MHLQYYSIDTFGQISTKVAFYDDHSLISNPTGTENYDIVKKRRGYSPLYYL